MGMFMKKTSSSHSKLLFSERNAASEGHGVSLQFTDKTLG